MIKLNISITNSLKFTYTFLIDPFISELGLTYVSNNSMFRMAFSHHCSNDYSASRSSDYCISEPFLVNNPANLGLQDIQAGGMLPRWRVASQDGSMVETYLSSRV